MTIHPAPRRLLATFAAFLVGALVPAHADLHRDAVDIAVTHQIIDNFGASDAWTFQKIGAWKEENKNRVADLLFSVDKGIGLTLWRFNLGGGLNAGIQNPWRTVETFETAAGRYDWYRQAHELWFARAARDRGVPYLLAFVNSPPGRMTKNGLTNSGTDETSTTNLKAGMEKPFATYLCDILEHFRTAPEKDRLVFNYVSPVNEPPGGWNAEDGQEGNRASNADVKRILLALHHEIAARKLDVKITAPECNRVSFMLAPASKPTQKYGALYGDYIRDFCGDPAILPTLDGLLCYHDYDSYNGPNVEKDHLALSAAIARYPGMKLWMSEICFLQKKRDLGMTWALDIARLIHADLALAGSSAWQFWLALSNGDYKDGLLYTDWRRPGDEENIIDSKAFWVVGNYSRFIRPGFVRVELVGDKHSTDGLVGSAYRDPKTGRLVLVYTNRSSEPQKVAWTFRAVDDAVPAKFVPWVTSETENLQPHAPVNATAGIEIPPRSVVTLVSQN